MSAPSLKHAPASRALIRDALAEHGADPDAHATALDEILASPQVARFHAILDAGETRAGDDALVLAMATVTGLCKQACHVNHENGVPDSPTLASALEALAGFRPPLLT